MRESILLEMDTAKPVQIPNEAVCISNYANTLGKRMNSTIVAPAMVK